MVSLFLILLYTCHLFTREGRQGRPYSVLLVFSPGMIHDVVIDMEMNILQSDPVRSNKHQSFMGNI